MFVPNRGFSGMADSTVHRDGTTQNVVGPTLVAMATKIVLGTEIQ